MEHDPNHLAYLDANVIRLRKGGYQSIIVPPRNGAPELLVFYNMGGKNGKPKATNVFTFHTETMNQVTNERVSCKEIFNAFTTGGIAWNDNFDAAEDGVRVENLAFGAAKSKMEQWMWGKMTPEERESKRAELINDMDKADEVALTWAKRKNVLHTDPVALFCKWHAAELAASKRFLLQANITSENLHTDFIAHQFFNLRDQILDRIVDGHPAIAKMGIGRNAKFIFPAYDRMDQGVVFYIRRYVLSRHPAMAYLFCLLHKFGRTREVSDGDDDWAVKMPNVAKDEGALDAFLEGAPYTDQRERLTYITSIFPLEKKLGEANRWVAESLMSGNVTEPDSPKLPLAKQMLHESGWTSWLNSKVYPSADVFNPPRLPDTMLELLHMATFEDARKAVTHVAHYLSMDFPPEFIEGEYRRPPQPPTDAEMFAQYYTPQPVPTPPVGHPVLPYMPLLNALPLQSHEMEMFAAPSSMDD